MIKVLKKQSKKRSKRSTYKRFNAFERKFGKREHVVFLSKTSETTGIKPHFFRSKNTVERKKKELKIKFPEIDTKIVSYRKSVLLYLD